MRIVSWNINQRVEPWQWLVADSEVDVALLQEATAPSPFDPRLDVVAGTEGTTVGWEKREFCTAVVRCSERFGVAAAPRLVAFDAKTEADTVPVSRPGTLAVATVSGGGLDAPIVVASVYAAWERPVPYVEGGWIYADASAHRLISDLSAVIDTQRGHRLIVAGDWNILRGYGEHGSPYWARRYQTVFDRMEAIGLRFVGPQHPDGTQADPWPDELPEGSANVPTFRTRQADPASATRQLDFVFASTSIADRVTTRARNGPGEWGPSDHCRIQIDVEETR